MYSGRIAMRFTNRITTIVLVVCMLFSGMTAFASGASTYSLKVHVTQNYDQTRTVLKLVNKERTKRGLKKLKLDKKLCDDAVQRAAEVSIAVPWKSPHKRPNGKRVNTLDKRIMYECCAESEDMDPDDIVDSWMESSAHKKGILLKNARTIGIACVTTTGYDQYWILEFSSTKLKKAETRTGKVSLKKKVVMKSSIMRKKDFWLFPKGNYHYYEKNGIDELGMFVGNSADMRVYYDGKESARGLAVLLDESQFTWKSSDPAALPIDENGVMTATAAADQPVTITATMKKSPGYSITTKVYVTNEGDYDDDWDGDDDWDDYDDWDENDDWDF